MSEKCHKQTCGAIFAAAIFSTSGCGSLNVDRLVRQMVLMPNGIENTERAGESDSEYPGKVPHSASSIETG
jgi:hypothetical protein